ncbi:MAG: hypothetical protein IJS62_05130, partial [Bacteroidales bacterium]|nr:hypothetical protein [Bacteroidales bacterium]
MKKITFYTVLAACGIFVSCNEKQEPANPVSPVSEGTEVLLNVNDALWTGEAKTAYTPGSGVGLTGEEMLSLYYRDANGKYQGNIKASPTATAGQYSFTVPAETEGITHWYGVMPYSTQVNGFNSGRTAVNFRLGPVQFPGANSFDPHCDYLIAQPFDLSGDPGAKSGEIVSFKRIFAPLCIAVSGLESGERIYTATLSLSEEPTAASALSGVFFLTMDDDYAGTYAVAGSGACGNAVSAEYATGLEAVDGRWPVWLMVNPMTIAAGGTLTLNISTADKTYERSVILPADRTLGTDALNLIKFNIKGDGYTAAESVTQDFTAQVLTGDKSLTASDGSALEWSSSLSRSFSSANDNGSGITGAMWANAAFTFPSIPGKNIVGARIYCHPASRYGGGAAASTLTVDGTDTYNFNLASFSGNDGMAYSGGVLDIDLPDGRTSLSGLTVTPTTQQNLISAITLFTEDASIDPDDYYAQYEAGRDISINGTIFNKATCGEARLLKLYEMANADALVADYTANGILFLDYDEADGQTDEKAFGYRLQPQNTVIIGRYRDHQPHIDLAAGGNFGVESKGAEIHLKNVKLTTGNAMFNTANLAEGSACLDVNIEDCTLESGNNYLFLENNASKGFRNIVVNNSVIKITRSLYEVYSSRISAGSSLGIEKFHLTNSVVYGASAISYPTIALRVSSSSFWYTPDLDLNLDHDTFYNLLNNNLGLVGLASMARLNVNHCVGDATLTRNVPIVFLHAALETKVSDSTIRNNYFNDRGGTYKWSYGYSALSNSGVTAGANTFPEGNVSPFSDTDTSNGYFPVNTSVVTNGAGA